MQLRSTPDRNAGALEPLVELLCLGSDAPAAVAATRALLAAATDSARNQASHADACFLASDAHVLEARKPMSTSALVSLTVYGLECCDPQHAKQLMLCQ